MISDARLEQLMAEVRQEMKDPKAQEEGFKLLMGMHSRVQMQQNQVAQQFVRKPTRLMRGFQVLSQVKAWISSTTKRLVRCSH
jgi:hypothetical protein